LLDLLGHGFGDNSTDIPPVPRNARVSETGMSSVAQYRDSLQPLCDFVLRVVLYFIQNFVDPVVLREFGVLDLGLQL
jgi:hypothetical protein